MNLHVVEIERFAIHDGPGIRTTVFLQGCPLRCPWCANPESQTIRKHLMYQASKCVGCGACLEACQYGAVRFENGRPVFLREKCVGCGACVEACLYSALRLSGETMDVEEVLRVLLRDRHYYQHSGGGITVSGGEPFVQAQGLLALVQACRGEGLHVAVETTGDADSAAFREIQPFIDLFLFDLKHPDAQVLREVTCGNLGRILSNLQSVPPEKVVLRIPVIPGFNADALTLERIFGLAQSFGIRRVDLLPYHNLGKGKYERLGLPYALEGVKALTKADLAPWKRLGESMGLQMNE